LFVEGKSGEEPRASQLLINTSSDSVVSANYIALPLCFETTVWSKRLPHV
jgi:hypothetical protein